MSITQELKDILHDIANAIGLVKDAIVGEVKDDAEKALDKIADAVEKKAESGLDGLTDRLVDKIKNL